MFDLKEISTKAPKKAKKEEIKAKTLEIIAEISDLQYLMFAEHKRALLVVLQGMDASGKDGLVRKIFSGVNPQGVWVKSFKAPTEEEKDHDFLWRVHKAVPPKGMIHVFNRSHYEEVLITRVQGWVDDKTAKKRFEYINAFEKMLEDQDTIILKFYLHVSEEEQKKRFQERLEHPEKFWKFSPQDLLAAQDREAYEKYYAEIFEHCSPDIPWNIVPADNNWYKEYVVAEKIAETLRKLDMKFPTLKM